jgi:hypothetical protein
LEESAVGLYSYHLGLCGTSRSFAWFNNRFISLICSQGATRHTDTKFKEYERRSHPYISPRFGNFSALKSSATKVHVTYGAVELIHEEHAEFVEKLRTKIGPELVDEFVTLDAVHDYQLVFPYHEASVEAFEVQRMWFEDKTAAAPI